VISPLVSSSASSRTQPERRPPSPCSEPYFTAGRNHGTGGLFGYLKPVSTELTVGNDQ
jgi:hypothetical protein